MFEEPTVVCDELPGDSCAMATDVVGCAIPDNLVGSSLEINYSDCFEAVEVSVCGMGPMTCCYLESIDSHHPHLVTLDGGAAACLVAFHLTMSCEASVVDCEPSRPTSGAMSSTSAVVHPVICWSGYNTMWSRDPV